MSSGDPSPLEQRLREALAEEYAAGWPFYDTATGQRLGDDAARMNLPVMLRALRRAGLDLTEAQESKP